MIRFSFLMVNDLRNVKLFLQCCGKNFEMDAFTYEASSQKKVLKASTKSIHASQHAESVQADRV